MVHDSRLRQDEGETSQQPVTQRRAPRRYQCKDQCREVKEQLLAANKVLQITVRHQKIELFESWKAAGNFDKAEKFYEGLLANDFVGEIGAENAEIILNLKQSYVDMLIKQGRFEKALNLAKEVWDKRQGADPVPDISRECHRQLCSIYASLNKPEEAERMHKLAYEWYRGREDSWALENGDECCEKLAQQHKYDEAALMQANVWTERQKAANGGPRHPDTIKSGKSRIALLEKLSATLTDQAGTESEKNMRRSERETCEHKIDQALQYIWDTAENPERDTEILDVGHKLGHRLLAGKRYPEAEAVLNQVWQGRILATNEANAQAMSTGRLLAAAIKFQGSTERYQRAAAIYWPIWKNCKQVFGEGDGETISVGIDLAETLCSLRQYSSDGGAEEVYGWVLEQPQFTSRQDASTVVGVRFDLGRVMYYQGQTKYAKAAGLLQKVYDQWYETSPDADCIYECGHLLLEIYKHQKAVEPIKAIFDGRKRLETRGILYLQSGYAYGKLLVEQENYDLARETMRSLWEYEATSSEEEEEFRLRCGRLYGQTLLKLEQHVLARDVLQAVLEAQTGVFSAGTSEANKVSQLLGWAQEAISVRTIPKLPGKNVKGAANRKRRTGIRYSY